MASAKKNQPKAVSPRGAGAAPKELLIEALSYIGKFKGQVVVIKYGGAAMAHPAIKKSFCEDVVLLRSLGMRPVIVHGGGPEVNRAMEAMGHRPEFVNGLRVTSQEALRITEMVLSGSVNKEIVADINAQGGQAVGLSGKDASLIRARKIEPVDGVDLGWVGRIVSVQPAILALLLENGYIPVVSPLGCGEDGQTYNINADTVASHIAAAMNARKVIFMTDVDGVLQGGRLTPTLTAAEAGRLIGEQVIAGGMIPKVEAMLHALAHGVGSAHIINGNEHHAIIAELFTDQGIGTIITG